MNCSFTEFSAPTPPPAKAPGHSPAGRRGAARATMIWLTALAAVLALYTTAFTVRTNEVAIVARFGDMRRVIDEPGLHFRWPTPVDSVYRVDMRRHVLDPDPGEFLTQDSDNLEIDSFVAWSVADPKLFYASLRGKEGAEARLAPVLRNAMTKVINGTALDDMIGTEKRERDLAAVTRSVKGLVAAECEENGYGIDIELVGLERLTFSADNMPAIERTMESERRGVATSITIEAQELAKEIQLDGDRQVAEIESQSKADAERIRAEGEAAAARIEAEAIALDPEFYRFLKLIETAEEAFDGSGLVILPASSPLLQALFGPLNTSSASKEGQKE